MPSFDSVNYAIRPNKNVERKLMAECLKALEMKFDIPSYHYIGLGSMWFVDFILFHKMLSIDKMYSIERPKYADRADFNKPLNCIEVLSGETTKVLPDIDLSNRRHLIWLDYDRGLDGSALEDIAIVCKKAKSGSILIVTINASLTQLSRKNEQNEEITRADALKELTGILTLPYKEKDFTTKKFPPILGKILFDKAKNSTIKAGRNKRFYPIFNFFYIDSTPMITIGGMVSNETDKTLLDQCDLKKNFDYVTEEIQYKIDIPPLTPKEKIALDRLLPCQSLPSAGQIEASTGFKLKQSQIDSYSCFYKHYPVYAEIAL